MTRDEVIATLRQMNECALRDDCRKCPHNSGDCMCITFGDEHRAARVFGAAVALLESAPSAEQPAQAPATDHHKLLAGLEYCRQVEDCGDDCPIRAECHALAAIDNSVVPAVGILTLAANAIRALLETPAAPAPAANAAHDPVNHPAHYTYGKHECIEEMEILFGREAVIAYCRCAAYKYKYRAGHKDDATQDYAKADWYIDKAAELMAAPDIIRNRE